MKRFFDIVLSVCGLLLLSPFFILIAILVKTTSEGPVLYKQERMGRRLHPFYILKFRSMIQDASRKGGVITVGGDRRITSIGHFIRKWKIDELPQLINVFKGDMSFVGPRPEVRKFVEMFLEDYNEILKVRPGITDLASIIFRDESEILAASENPEEEYVRHILPEKIRLNKEYVNSASIFNDIKIIYQTLCRVFDCRPLKK